jgi:hypothetical protein
MSDPRLRPPLTVRRWITVTIIGNYILVLLGGCSLIGSVLLLGHFYDVGTLGSAWFCQLESALFLNGTLILTGVILWSIAALFFGGIPIVAGLLLWWITIRVDRQAQSERR